MSDRILFDDLGGQCFEFADQALRCLMKPWCDAMVGRLNVIHLASGVIVVVLTEIMKYKVDSEVRNDMAVALIPVQCSFLYRLPGYFTDVADLSIFGMPIQLLGTMIPSIQAVFVMLSGTYQLELKRILEVYAPAFVLQIFTVGAVSTIVLGRSEFDLTAAALCLVAALNVIVLVEFFIPFEKSTTNLVDSAEESLAIMVLYAWAPLTMGAMDECSISSLFHPAVFLLFVAFIILSIAPSKSWWVGASCLVLWSFFCWVARSMSKAEPYDSDLESA